MIPQAYCPIDREAEHQLIEKVASRAADEWVAQLHVYAPQLIHLIAEAHDQPMRRLAPQVRRLVLECEHCDDAGDACSHSDDALEQHVHLLIDAMEELRREREALGGWSFVPAPPPMFG